MAQRRALMIIVSCLVGLRAADAYAADPNRAAAFGWRGSVDTDFARCCITFPKLSSPLLSLPT